MPRPTLPLGRKAPWILLAVAAILATTGFITSNREMLILATAAATFWLVAFPLSAFLLGPDTQAPEDAE